MRDFKYWDEFLLVVAILFFFFWILFLCYLDRYFTKEVIRLKEKREENIRRIIRLELECKIMHMELEYKIERAKLMGTLYDETAEWQAERLAIEKAIEEIKNEIKFMKIRLNNNSWSDFWNSKKD